MRAWVLEESVRRTRPGRLQAAASPRRKELRKDDGTAGRKVMFRNYKTREKQRNKNKRSNRMTRSHMKSAPVSQPPTLLSSPVLELWRMTRLISNLKLYGKISKICHLWEALLNYFWMTRLNNLLSTGACSVQCISQASRPSHCPFYS